jgi:tripartite-type tricarboxylate transporter receptor subunit TctC
MRLPRRRFLHLAAVAIGTLAAPGLAAAQAYPARPIQVIVPFAGGSASDVVMRILLDRMAKSLGQPFVVDNRPGQAAISAPTRRPRQRPTATRW